MRTLLAALVILGTASGQSVRLEPKTAIKCGKIITVSGEEIENGIILVSGGKIEAVGKDVEIPWDAKVIDASTKVVMPGWIEAHSFRGVDRANENVPSVPFVSVWDSINPVDPYFEDCLRQGITTVYVSPGNMTMIGGQGCVVRTTGTTIEEMTVVKNLAMKISLEPRRGLSRMAHLAALRREFDEILQYMADLKEKREVRTSTDKAPAEIELEFKREAMVALLEGKMWAHVYCPDAASVLKAIELSKQYKFRMKLVVGWDAWKAADEIAKEGLEVVLDPSITYWETDEERHEEVLRIAPLVFWKSKVKFALQTDGGSFGTGYLWYQAATAVKYGVPRAEAIKAATLNAAQFLGLGDRFGSIEKGKDANLLILTGDPLDTMTWVDTVLIEGKVAYERSRDEKLQRVLGGK
jgi:imidazolonepropionase-like amidohydrolase